ncbi:RecQ family ATP-dependent DNA helicase [Lactobacillus sp. S2-2]|uniref:RecQ family ATP-dependent DNA helicase n=1 Tax=Lactobacillus sp. S2-2 TaxID=2692917 RepID=UPI001EFF8670|nr:RecQ family ATP-dependent DNA helicase [Lactobacillus sp. S2-2]MCF6515017.1 RecQ family ATP-dependent DNA helicase [Lactobacillus sp. S2-2]
MENYELVLNILKKKFGFSKFKEGQFETINSLIVGNDVLSILPTGAGKSLIYQLYGYYKQKPIVVITPLISLMYDQVKRMNMMGENKAVTLNSDFDWFQKKVILNNLDQYRFIFISPEYISQDNVFNIINNLDLGLLVIDEAHCVSTWGNDFRPAYLNLRNVIKNFSSKPQLLLLTATASKNVLDDIQQILDLNKLTILKKSINRENIYLKNIKYEDQNSKDEDLLYLLNNLAGSGIVYFSSKTKADEMSKLLIDNNANLRVGVYHADIDDHDRFVIQQQFMNNEIDIVFATSAFGMGIDKSDIRFVIHYHLPQNIEDYFQEIGRAGRDNQKSIAILMYSRQDEYFAKNLIDYSLPDESEINLFDSGNVISNQDKEDILNYYRKIGYPKKDLINLFSELREKRLVDLNHMIDYAKNEKYCRRNIILSYFDEPEITHSEFCCDINSNEVINTFFRKEQGKIKSKELNWKEIIEKLF